MAAFQDIVPEFQLSSLFQDLVTHFLIKFKVGMDITHFFIRSAALANVHPTVSGIAICLAPAAMNFDDRMQRARILPIRI